MQRIRTWLFWIAMVAGVGAVAIVSLWPKPHPVQVARVESGWMEVAITQEGMTRIKDRYVVSATVGGKLSRIALRPGDTLSRGQSLLASIQPTLPPLLDARQTSQLDANVEAAKRQVELADARRQQAQSQLSLAESQYGRLKVLHEQGTASDREWEQAEADYRARSEELRVANFEWEIRGFELQQAEAARRHFRDEDSGEPQQFELLSPIDGVVLRIFEESSTVVTPGQPLLEVGNPSDLEVVIDVLSTDAVKIQAGNPVVLQYWGGDGPLLAEVRRVEPAAFTKVSALGVEEQRVNVLADFREPATAYGRLGDQYRVEARVIIWKEDQILQVPHAALFRWEGQWAVFVVQEQRLSLQRVEVGRRNETHAQVLSGLEGGQTVVIYPSDLLAEGDAVSVD